MATPAQPPELVGLVCVVDTSLTVAAQWETVLKEYIQPLLQRLVELYSPRGQQFRVGFVSYATATTRPSPLVARLNFGLPMQVMNQLRTDRGKLGIGQTGSGGGRGMAALEGLVAGIELFDTLRSSGVKMKANYVIHIAAAHPDTTERPLHNVIPILDDVTWDSLPAEFSKRDINYSNILLDKIVEFAALHDSAASGAAQSPWFQIRPKHDVHLAGFPAPLPKGVKRTIDGTPVSDRSPENKRIRAETQNSPHVPQASPQPPHSVPESAPPPAMPFSQNQNSNLSAMSRSAAPESGLPTQQGKQLYLSEALEKLESFEKAIKGRMRELEAAEAAGRGAEVATMRQSLEAHMQHLYKIRKTLKDGSRTGVRIPGSQAPLNQSDASSSQENMSKPVQHQNDGGSGPSFVPLSASAPYLKDVSAPFADASTSDPPQSQPFSVPRPSSAAFLQSSTSANSGANPGGMPLMQLGNPLPSNVSPQMIQMQKLIEQQRRAPHTGIVQPPPQNLPPAHQPPAHLENVSGPAPPTNASAPNGNNPPTPIWRGAFTWRGFEGDAPGRNQAFVIAHTHATAEQLRVDKWPSNLTLTPCPDPVVPMTILQDWIKRHGGVLTYIVPFSPQKADGKMNTDNLLTFARHLAEKPQYALAAWNGPSGLPENHILIFPAKAMLAGVVFPGEVPELPKPDTAPNSLAQLPPQIQALLTRLPPDQQRQIASLPLEQRNQTLRSLAAHMRGQQAKMQGQQQNIPQQQQPQQQPTQAPKAPSSKPQSLFNPFVGGGINIENVISGFVRAPQQQQPVQLPMGGMSAGSMGMGMSAGMGGMNMNVGQMSTMSMPGPGGGGMHQPNGSGTSMGGPGVGALSAEMMQSFMQRNLENSGGAPGMGS